MSKLRIAVFVSGRGSNFRSIFSAAESGRLHAEICLVVASSSDAGALEFAMEKNIPSVVINRHNFSTRVEFIQKMIDVLKQYRTDFIALAGYMKKIPEEIINVYSGAITNIHPGLLPAFGGRGMYGGRVHKAVLEGGCKISGVTIHLVDSIYDHGPIVAQRCVEVEAGDTPQTLAARILKMEHQLYPEVLEDFARGRVEIKDNIVTVRRDM